MPFSVSSECCRIINDICDPLRCDQNPISKIDVAKLFDTRPNPSSELKFPAFSALTASYRFVVRPPFMCFMYPNPTMPI